MIIAVTLSFKQLIIWGVTAVLLAAFWYLVAKTRLGRAQRACEQDQKMAALVGVDVDRTISMTFVIAAALAAVAGTMYLMYYGVVSFSDGFVPGVKAFTAAVLGGIGSLPGAVIGGIADRPDRDHVVGLFFHRLQGRRRLFRARHHLDLPAAGPVRPAGCREGLRCRTARQTSASISPARLRDAGLTALLAFGLFLPLIGFQTVTDIRNDLILNTRWPLLLAIVAIVGAGRLAFSLVVEPWLKQRSAAAGRGGAIGLAHGLSPNGSCPFAIGFVIVYPPLVIAINGFGGAVKWIDNFGIQILIYVMLGWGLNIVVGPRRPARPRLCRLLRGRRLFLCAAGQDLRLLRSGSCCRSPAFSPRSGASCSAFRCCVCAATISPSSRSPSAKSSASSLSTGST